MTPNYVLLVNPHANGGRAIKRLDAATRALSRIGGVSVQVTRAPGDEPRIVREAIENDAQALCVLGGDGTVSHAARALVNAQSTMPLAILAAGTGNDFAKSLNAPVHDYDAMSSLIASGTVRIIDVGRVDDYVFVNSAGFGFDVRVQQETEKPGRLRGKALYIKAAVGQLLRYSGFRARLTHNLTERDENWLMVVFANGGYFGAAFHIAPSARIDDAQLDCVALANASALDRVRIFAAAPRGAHVRHANVRVTRAPHYTLDFDEPAMFEADGELRRASSSHVEIIVVPNALRVVSR